MAKARLLAACLAGATLFLCEMAGAAPAAPKPAPVKWYSDVKVVRIGEESAVDTATIRFGDESGRKFESWITTADLPAAYRSKLLSTDSFLVVQADAAGKPAGCRALRPSAEPALDSLACRLLVERAAFRPIYEAPGRPIGARWVIAVRWNTFDEAHITYTAPPVRLTAPGLPKPGMNDYNGWPRLDWHDEFLFENLPDAHSAYRAPVKGPKAGRVSLDLIADPEGGIVGCEIGVGSGSAELDAAACALARRIQLRYRRTCEDCFRDRVPIQIVWDPRGSRIRLPLASPSRWPRPDPSVPTYITARRRLPAQVSSADFKGIKDLAVSRSSLLARLSVNAEGKPTACTIVRSSGNPAVDTRACELFLKRNRYTVRTDVFGDPVGDTVSAWMGLTGGP
jgi:hypothetical protein